MPKFNVTIEETCRYTMTVEAQDEEQAGLVAEDTVVNCEEPWMDFIAEVTDRRTFVVMKAPDTAEVTQINRGK